VSTVAFLYLFLYTRLRTPNFFRLGFAPRTTRRKNFDEKGRGLGLRPHPRRTALTSFARMLVTDSNSIFSMDSVLHRFVDRSVSAESLQDCERKSAPISRHWWSRCVVGTGKNLSVGCNVCVWIPCCHAGSSATFRRWQPRLLAVLT